VVRRTQAFQLYGDAAVVNAPGGLQSKRVVSVAFDSPRVGALRLMVLDPLGGAPAAALAGVSVVVTIGVQRGTVRREIDAATVAPAWVLVQRVVGPSGPADALQMDFATGPTGSVWVDVQPVAGGPAALVLAAWAPTSA